MREKKLKAGITLIWPIYERHEVTFKKDLHAAEQPSLYAPRLVFIDKTAVTAKMVRQYGRSPARRASGRQGSARPLEDTEARGRAAHRWRSRLVRH